MSIEWSRLRILDAVARTGSVTRAAALLHLTGPAVSQQLRRIETEAGARVVIPDGRGVRLTSEGRILASYATRVADLMVQAENDLSRDDELVGRVCLGALASIIRTPVVDAFSTFQSLHPRVELRIEDGETAQHLDELAGGRLDMAFAESWSPSPLTLPAGITARRLTRETVWVAVPEKHPLSGKGQVRLSELSAETWATCARGSDGHRAITQVARREGIELDIRHFVADHLTQLALVRAGLAVACIPVTSSRPESPGVAYVRLRPDMSRDIVLLTSDRTPPRPVERLVAHLVSSLPSK